MTKTAAIIGGGVIGGGWAARFLLNGWDANIFDPDPDANRKINEVLANARYALPMLYDVSLPSEGTLTFCNSVSDAVKTADWIQESVPERLELKHKVIQTLQEHCNRSAVIASSTSGFKPSELQNGANRPDQILVAHPFNPVYLLPVVELVPSPKTHKSILAKARDILTEIGMHPIHVRKEIDAHIADRLLEAIWREALWLIKDDIATTQEIDDVIRYGFGLRWAQMGLFETYRIAGGEAGMYHFIEQFGPCLKWPWTKLMDVPELTEDLTNRIADQSDAQSGHLSIRELERLRDNNLVAILRALKGQNTAAGALLNKHEAKIISIPATTEASVKTIERTVPADWTDYNAHMNESRYGQVFSDAADKIMQLIGADADYLASGFSYFTVDIHIKFLQETHAGQKISVTSKIVEGRGKKLRLYHKMADAKGKVLATAEQLLLHVSLKTRRTCDPGEAVALKLEKLVTKRA
ncbi:MAG: carnitine 3-dehydrogenase [Paracoccaceae bacterium]